MGKARYDWKTVRTDYIESLEQLSLRALANKHNVNYKALVQKKYRDKGSSRDWDISRELFWRRVKRQHAEDRIKEQVEKYEQLDKVFFQGIIMATTGVVETMKRNNQMLGLQKRGNSDNIEVALDIKEISALSKNWSLLVKALNDLSDLASKSRGDLGNVLNFLSREGLIETDSIARISAVLEEGDRQLQAAVRESLQEEPASLPST